MLDIQNKKQKIMLQNSGLFKSWDYKIFCGCLIHRILRKFWEDQDVYVPMIGNVTL